MKTLDLGNCGLTEIPEELFELVWLEELSFSDNYFEWDGKIKAQQIVNSNNRGAKNRLSALPQSFVKLRALKKLMLSGGFGDNDWGISDVSPLSTLFSLRIPKRRFYRVGWALLVLFSVIATPPLISGFIKSANNQYVDFALQVGQGMNPWLAGAMASMTLGSAVALFYLDHKQR